MSGGLRLYLERRANVAALISHITHASFVMLGSPERKLSRLVGILGGDHRDFRRFASSLVPRFSGSGLGQ